MKHKYINTFCFIRNNDHKDTEENRKNLYLSVEKQIDLNNKYNLAASYLFEADALLEKKFVDLVTQTKKQVDEIGLWFEVVKPLAERAGIKWRGRDGRVWDYFVDPGFLPSYTEDEKHILIDTVMKMFFDVFGFFPKTVASWLIDSESMRYMSEKYEIDAFLICREQWGTDAYTLWGGPYYGGYYPCKNNMQCPAQTIENQINTPVFRVFINDPIYSYYELLREKFNGIDCGLFTQEPAWMCGHNPDWIKWQFDNIYSENSIGFKYLQLGQENGFTWEGRVDEALMMHHEFVKENRDKYQYENVTFCEMGRRFKEQYKMTPPSAVGTLTDWANNGNQSVWFNNINYRINVFCDGDKVYIRDIHFFNEKLRDKYLDTPCKVRDAVYDNLPIMDGLNFSTDEIKAGMYFGKGNITGYSQKDNYYEVTLVAEKKQISIKLYDDRIEFSSNKDFKLDYIIGKAFGTEMKTAHNRIDYMFDGFGYSINLETGIFESDKLISSNGKITICFNLNERNNK